jgi:hypothetical protein
MKKFLLLFAIIFVSIVITVLYKYLTSAEFKVNQFNNDQGPLEIKQEYTGPNSDYLTPPNYDSI